MGKKGIFLQLSWYRLTSLVDNLAEGITEVPL